MPRRGNTDPRFIDWTPNTVLFETVLEPPTPRTLRQTVVHEKDRVIAYFDDGGRSVPKEFATWAKVWTEDTLMIIGIDALSQPVSEAKAAEVNNRVSKAGRKIPKGIRKKIRAAL